MNINNRLYKAILRGLNEALAKFNLDDFEDDTISSGTDIKLDKTKSTKSALLKSVLNEETYLWIKENFVDLDLPSGTLWMKYNLGATEPEEFGDYYAWGETEPKDRYGWDTYKFCDDNNNCIKYNNLDNITQLDLEDDAAYQIDNRICMSTIQLLRELIKYTDNNTSQYNGVDGYIFKSKLDSSKFIFLPAAGYMKYDSLDKNKCRYWSSNIVDSSDRSDIDRAYSCSGNLISMNGVFTLGTFRILGFPIRPVLKK